MATLTLVLEAPMAKGQPLPEGPNLYVVYTREIRADRPNETATNSSGARQFRLSRELAGRLELEDYAAGTTIDVSITTPQGSPIVVWSGLRPTAAARSESRFSSTLTLGIRQFAALRSALTPQPPVREPSISRRGRFVVVGAPHSDFRNCTLIVSLATRAQLSREILSGLFKTEQMRSTARELSPDKLAIVSSLQLGIVRTLGLTLQGDFEFSLPTVDGMVGWLWLLSGAGTFVGIQIESNPVAPDRSTTILLPPARAHDGQNQSSSDTGRDAPPLAPDKSRPLDATEQELLDTPDLFSDDPGTICRPFHNPNRIVGERTFHTILRVTQPDIGGEPSVPPLDQLPPFPFSPELLNTPTVAVDEPDTRRPAISTPNPIGLSGLYMTLRAATPNNPLISTRAAVAARRRFTLANSKGRFMLEGRSALDWEGDSMLYQATSLALGHILEFRVRWRSNGYSLGNVAHTLSLAPRQTRRIMTAASRVVDRARRQEVTQFAETVTQQTDRDYSYLDAVRSRLSEWARGESEASSTSAAGGAGFAAAGFVIGGGAAHGSSQSSSSQQGGRNVAASEEQTLRDTIRQYGESLRKLESLVVIEASQEEFVQAISEVVRNPNYCHALTIIYHEILRHLRVDTEVVGARECVFVPFTIRPFTLERAIRWRDILEQYLRKPDLRWVMRYLQDVNENFSTSTVPEGRRAQQPIRFLSGSLFLQLAIERPRDRADGTLVEDGWEVLAAHLNVPLRGIISRLRDSGAARDAVFQREYAPAIAASWVNKLQLSGSAPFGEADFTLASRYEFNRTLRVDFTLTPTSLVNREDLQSLVVRVPQNAALPPSSVATLNRLDIHYFTDTFDRRESTSGTSDDLVDPLTGLPEQTGATAYLPLSSWERQDFRDVIRGAAADLVTPAGTSRGRCPPPSGPPTSRPARRPALRPAQTTPRTSRPNRFRAWVIALEVGTDQAASQQPNRSSDPVTFAATSS